MVGLKRVIRGQPFFTMAFLPIILQTNAKATVQGTSESNLKHMILLC